MLRPAATRVLRCVAAAEPIAGSVLAVATSLAWTGRAWPAEDGSLARLTARGGVRDRVGCLTAGHIVLRVDTCSMIRRRRVLLVLDRLHLPGA